MQKLTAGDLVVVRRARWRVVAVRPYDACQVLTLAAEDPTASGDDRERRVIAPFDAVDRVAPRTRARFVSPRTWRLACRELLAANAPPAALTFARKARMDFLTHQLEPTLALLRGLGSRVLLADDVGLGKTIEAALAAAELRARGWADRILILTPAGVRDQWAAELQQRLGIDAAIADAAGIRVRLSTLPVGVNPWTTMPVAIASMDYVKRPEVLPAVASCRWDVVIIDEAHGVAGDTDRCRAASALASRAPYVLLLTATPHSGDRRAFASLCGVGSLGGDPLLVFRRTRQDVRLGAKRRIHRLQVRPNAAELRMHALLARFTRAVRNEHGDRAALALSVLHKRALSSAQSLERSVERRLASLAVEGQPGTLQLALPLDDGDGELTLADDPPAWSADLALADARRERTMLERLREQAHLAGTGETKIRALRRLLRRIGEPAVVFTEYRDTLLHLRDALHRPVLVLHGGLSRVDRAKAVADFSDGGCAVLLATDAAGEGLNLHHSCRIVINLELPWNPMRLEQRIGRVDRIGQRRTVHAVHFIARETGEARILERLQARVERARADIGASDPIGLDEERANARLIVGGDAAESQSAVDSVPAACLFPHFDREAVAEADRLATARALTRGKHPSPDLDAPQIVRARHRKTRARLGRRVLLMLRADCEDGNGQLVESMLVPIAVDARLKPSRDVSNAPSEPSRHVSGFDARLKPSRYIADILRRNDAAVCQLADAAVSSWRAEVELVTSAFAAARLQRERSIASFAEPAWNAIQPGLFDRRASAALMAGAAARDRMKADLDDRVAAIERSALLTFRPARVLLVVTP